MKKRIITLLFGFCLVSLSACSSKTTFRPSDEASSYRNEKSSATDVKDSSKEDNEDDISPEQSAQEDAESSNEEGLGEEPSDNDESEEATSQDTESADPGTEKELVDGMRPAFKEAMDSYEEFMTEYCEFIKKYSESDGTDLSLLTDYADYMRSYADMMRDFEAWEDGDLNTVELTYYIDVQTRVNKKLLEVVQ